MISLLFIEVLLESRKLILLQDATLPPRLNKTEAVAHELHKGSRDAKQAYPKTTVADGRGISNTARLFVKDVTNNWMMAT